MPGSHDEPRFLVVRHARRKRHFYDVVLNWVAERFPRLRALFDVWDLPDETARDFPHRPDLLVWRRLTALTKRLIRRDTTPLRLLRGGIPDGSDYRLHLAWLQDPVEQWSQATFARACRLAAECHSRGVPVVNRVDRLANAAKSTAARLTSAAGIRTPRMAVIRDAAEFRETRLGIPLPLFVREDWGHCGRMWRADTPAEIRRLPVSRLKRPVAVEIVDVRDPRDGLFRKYRYVAAGEIGVSHHVQASSDWITRGDNRVVTEATRAEELDYISRPDPHHVQLQRARRALGLEMVAFDYGLTQEGELILWEANPFPHIKISKRGLAYRNAALHRTLLGLLHLYLTTAGLPVPGEIADGLPYDVPHNRAA